jgi:hypothetical protein
MGQTSVHGHLVGVEETADDRSIVLGQGIDAQRGLSNASTVRPAHKDTIAPTNFGAQNQRITFSGPFRTDAMSGVIQTNCAVHNHDCDAKLR